MKTMPFGTWPGALAAIDLATGGRRFGGVLTIQGLVVWMEGRPQDGGRGVLVRREEDGTIVDLTGDPYSVRSRVNEYGGGAFWAHGDGIAFINDDDQDIYLVDRKGDIRRITDNVAWRFADGTAVPGRAYALGEIARPGAHPQHVICAYDDLSGQVDTCFEGRDFFASPRLSPDGKQLAFLCWDLPYMPWQAAELWLADVLDDGTLSNARLIGGGLNRAAFQPEWSAQGQLHCILENGSGSSVYRWEESGWAIAADTNGEAGRPLWSLGSRSYAILADGRIAVAPIRDGTVDLYLTRAGESDVRRLGAKIVDVSGLTALDNSHLIALTERADSPSAVEVIDLAVPDAPAVLRQSGSFDLNEEDIARPELHRFPTPEGEVWGLYYAPTFKGHHGEDGELPPMIVSAHGGPTGYAPRGFDAKTQFWTGRGFALLDVDYRGSFGYGPQYRRALDGRMGEIDIDDTIAAARAAAEMGLADPARLLISGGSAGGYVALGALAYSDVFRAGCSRYGIGDLRVLDDTTHKFEAGYLKTLLGLNGERLHDIEVFRLRSPLFSVDKITAPVLLLQGMNDKIVPYTQSRDMYDALYVKGQPVSLIEFEGEGHGFRKAETIAAALDIEYSFYCRILGLKPENPLKPLEIANWFDRQ